MADPARPPRYQPPRRPRTPARLAQRATYLQKPWSASQPRHRARGPSGPAPPERPLREVTLKPSRPRQADALPGTGSARQAGLPVMGVRQRPVSLPLPPPPRPQPARAAKGDAAHEQLCLFARRADSLSPGGVASVTMTAAFGFVAVAFAGSRL